ncbi:MAG: hypothetical protein AAGJ50_13070, partial [Pseudomonadota bacterium]
LMNMSGTLEGNLHYGAVQYALGQPPVDISPLKIFANMLWGSAILLITLVMAFGLSIQNLWIRRAAPWQTGTLRRGIAVVLPSLTLAGFAHSLWFQVPRSFGINFAGASLFYPDLGALMLAQIVLAVAWTAARTALLLQRLKNQKIHAQ